MPSLKRESVDDAFGPEQKRQRRDPDFYDYCSRFTDLLDDLARDAELLVKDSHFFRTGLKQSVTDLRNPAGAQRADPQKICFLGRSGVGKSSLYNSLIHEKNLSRTVSSLHYSWTIADVARLLPRTDVSKYRAEVTYFSDEEIKSMINEYLDKLSAFHTETDETEEPRSDDEQTDLRNSEQSFFLMIHSLFPELPHLATDEQIMEVIRKDWDDNTNEFQRWVTKECIRIVQRASSLSTGPYRSATDFENPADLRRCVQPLGSTQHGDSGQSHVWPLVKRIRICIANLDLLRNVILADAPGTGDCNSTRAMNCHLYLKECDYLFVVASIKDRIASDKDIDKLLNHYKARFEGKISLVVTSTDLPVNPSDVKDFISELKSTKRTSLVDRYLSLRGELKGVTGMPKNANDKAELKQRVKELKHNRDEMHRVLRSESSKSSFQRIRKMNIPMFFVSNPAYWQHFRDADGGEESENDDCDTDDSDGKPKQALLSLKDTGINDLRSFIRGVPMISIHRALDAHLGRFQAITETLKATCEARPIEDRNELQRILDNFKAQMTTSTLSKAIKDDTARTMRSKMQKSHWISSALSSISAMERWSARSLKAGVTGYGVHTIRKVHHKNWVMEFTRPAQPVFESGFKALKLSLENRVIAFESQLQAQFVGLAKKISGTDNPALGWDSAALDLILGSVLRVIKTKTDYFKEAVWKEERNIHMECTKFTDLNYFNVRMRRRFPEMVALFGTGFRKNLIAFLRKMVTAEGGDDIFEAWFSGIIKTMKKNQDARLEQLAADVEVEVTTICKNLMQGGNREAKYNELKTGMRDFSTKVDNAMPTAENYLVQLKEEINKWEEGRKD
ncbi:hypothetical protein BDZ85DRAFT_298928 [Elsinoe ampelina]|uniref:P-loop containing nucleoside triphosphate hydrolase protein n=1 Tax=Elsinoe ampelina TaxID=302913 RepID=A0A6A6G147_9PEZI|nr:hypothetical protein BDZ85DRAFT_298928 [Elsinoe ampelina]